MKKNASNIAIFPKSEPKTVNRNLLNGANLDLMAQGLTKTQRQSALAELEPLIGKFSMGVYEVLPNWSDIIGLTPEQIKAVDVEHAACTEKLRFDIAVEMSQIFHEWIAAVGEKHKLQQDS